MKKHLRKKKLTRMSKKKQAVNKVNDLVNDHEKLMKRVKLLEHLLLVAILLLKQKPIKLLMKRKKTVEYLVDQCGKNQVYRKV